MGNRPRAAWAPGHPGRGLRRGSLTSLAGLEYCLDPVGALVVVTTVGTEEEANQLAEELVARRHSSCVNIVPVHKSIYRWKGKVCDDREYLLVIKTLEQEYEAVEETVRELHSYELPEILAFRVSRGEAGFLEWIAQSVDKSAGLVDDEDEGEDDEADDEADEGAQARTDTAD